MQPKNSCPILLVHGIARFDILQAKLMRWIPGLTALFGDRFHYFKGIKSHLAAHGFDVRHANVDFAGSVKKRAADLAAQVDRVGTKVHIIAHSMGGLDARHMIVSIPGMREKVATLTTIGTPHHGTVFADHCLSTGGKRLIDALRPVLDLDGFQDLTTTACAKFNAEAVEVEAANSVVYQTYSSAQQRPAVFRLLQPSWDIIHEAEGSNDGLVSSKSQSWLAELITATKRKAIIQKQFPFPADHLNQVGWVNPDAHRSERKECEARIKAFYLAVAEAGLISTASP